MAIASKLLSLLALSGVFAQASGSAEASTTASNGKTYELHVDLFNDNNCKTAPSFGPANVTITFNPNAKCFDCVIGHGKILQFASYKLTNSFHGPPRDPFLVLSSFMDPFCSSLNYVNEIPIVGSKGKCVKSRPGKGTYSASLQIEAQSF